MRSIYFIALQGVFYLRSKENPSFILADDTSDESISENKEHIFFTLTNTKKYSCDESVFLIMN